MFVFNKKFKDKKLIPPEVLAPVGRDKDGKVIDEPVDQLEVIKSYIERVKECDKDFVFIEIKSPAAHILNVHYDAFYVNKKLLIDFLHTALEGKCLPK